MMGRHYKDQFVQVNYHRMKLRFLRIVGEDSELGVVPQHIIRNVTAEGALDGDLDHGVQAAKLGQYRQQIKGGELVSGNRQLAFLQFAQFDQSFLRTIAQVQQPLGVFLKYTSGVGQQAVPRTTVKQRLADFLFQLSDRLADSRLRAK